tara:strand:- start:11 stop:712 length:702 start_codon:yes stop_codon:yes gene_type:complete
MTATPSRRGQSLKISGRKKKTKFKHNATKVVSTGRRTTKTVYWDQRSGSWKSTRNKPIGDGLKKDFSKTIYKTKKNYELSKENRNKDAEKKSKLIDNARKKGIAPSPDLRGTATRNQPNTNQSSNDDKPTTESKAKTNELEDDNDLADRKEEKNFRNSSSVEKAKQKSDPLRKYRRGGDTGRKETRITKKLKKAGFTSDRLAKLREKNAAFQKAKKGGKKAMEKYREKYPKRG